MARAKRFSLKRLLGAFRGPAEDDAAGSRGARGARGGTQGHGGEPEDVRKRVRFDLECDVVCDADGKTVNGELRDISTSGALIGGTGSLKPGTEVSLTIGLSGSPATSAVFGSPRR
jgi:hypothetical protein